MIMLGEIFYWVLNLSILGSFTGLILLMLRHIRKLPRFGVYLLWLLPLIRFWVPIGLANQYSLLNLLAQFTTKTIVVRKEELQFTMTNSIMAANSYFPIEYKSNLLKNIFAVCGVIWAIVMVGALLFSILLYFFTKKALINTNHIKDNIYKSDNITTPAVYGIIRPKIMLPSTLEDADLNYILLHEKTHIRRSDNLWRIVAVISACVHWFNPLIWIFLNYFFTDMELACDASVLKKLNRDQQKAYAMALLTYSVGNNYYASAFGNTKTKLRIENILSYKKLTLVSGLCFTVLLILIAITLITNAVG